MCKLDFRSLPGSALSRPITGFATAMGRRASRVGTLMHGGKQFISARPARAPATTSTARRCATCSTRRSSRCSDFPGSAEQRLGDRAGRASTAIAAPTAHPHRLDQKGFGAHRSFVSSTTVRPEIPRARSISAVSPPATSSGAVAPAQRRRRGRPAVHHVEEVPPDRLAAIRKAFDDTMKDPGFLAEMAKQQLPVHPIPGSGCGKSSTN